MFGLTVVQADKPVPVPVRAIRRARVILAARVNPWNGVRFTGEAMRAITRAERRASRRRKEAAAKCGETDVCCAVLRSAASPSRVESWQRRGVQRGKRARTSQERLQGAAPSARHAIGTASQNVWASDKEGLLRSSAAALRSEGRCSYRPDGAVAGGTSGVCRAPRVVADL
jgi:hypothetical protein